jgi:hypothetical protein
VGAKVKDMESIDDNTVTDLATCSSFILSQLFSCCFSSSSALMDVGSNVMIAATKTVSKDKENNPGAIIEVCRNTLID